MGLEGGIIKNIDNVQEVIDMPLKNTKIMITGAAGAGKSLLMLDRYIHMVERLGAPSESILVLLLNRTQSLKWRKKTILSGSGLICRTSYYGFVQSELRTYYPLLLKSCMDIGYRDIEPVFLNFESAQYLLAKVINKRREKEGLFEGVTSFSDRISIDLAANLVKAATSNIPYVEIGKRLYSALSQKDETRRRIYGDMDSVIASYRQKCMELGVFDFGMAVELYHNHLLQNQSYRQHLFNRFKHLIIDNLEECVPSQTDLVYFLIDKVYSCMISYNPEGGYGQSFGGNREYVEKRFSKKLDVLKLRGSRTCTPELFSFADKLYSSIFAAFKDTGTAQLLKTALDDSKTGPAEQHSMTRSIERNDPVELRSEMLEKIGERIYSLIVKDGYMPSDIAVLSTYADQVTEYVLERILKEKGYGIFNIGRKEKIVENPFSQALITLAQLCHPQYKIMPNSDHVRDLLIMVLKIDPVRSAIISGEICRQKPFAGFPKIDSPALVERTGYYNMEKYESIRAWIKEYREMDKPLLINEFFQRVFMEILLEENVNRDDILQAKKLIDSSKTFVDTVSRFNRNGSRDFLEMACHGIKGAESIFELQEKLTGDFVFLATPVSFLASGIESKVVILTSISSENWYPRSIRELTNPHVLTKTWDMGSAYTEELEEENRRKYLAVLMRNIIKRCGERLITFESDISSGGFENNGVLSEYFDGITGGYDGT